MSNEFYSHTGFPPNSAEGRAIDVRAEFLALQAAFDKMPALSGNANKLVVENASGNGLTTLGPTNVPLTSWIPVLTCTTPGNLVVAYTTQIGRVYRMGGFLFTTWDILTSTWTHTTASGNLIIDGVPQLGQLSFGSLVFSGLTKAGYTQFVPEIGTSSLQILIRACGSAQAGAIAQVTDFPTGGTVILRGCVITNGF